MNKLIKFLIERDAADYDVDVPDLQDKKEYKTHVSMIGRENALNPALMVPPKKKKKRKFLFEPPVVERDLLEIEEIILRSLGEQVLKDKDEDEDDLEKEITPDEAAALAAAGEPAEEEDIAPGPAGTIPGEEGEEDYAGSPDEDELEKEIDPEEAQALAATGEPEEEEIPGQGMGGETPDMGNTPTPEMGLAGAGATSPDMTGGMGGTGDMGAAGGAIDPTTGMPMGGGMPGASPADMGATFGAGDQKSPEQLGRIFELKKIYSRLLSIDQYLSFSSDEVLLKLKKYVSKSIEFFEMLISNIDAFKDKIDDIIIIYYDFLKKVYEVLRDYYDLQEEKSKDIKDNKK